MYGEPPISPVENIVKSSIDTQVGKLPVAPIAAMVNGIRREIEGKKLGSKKIEGKNANDKDTEINNKIYTQIPSIVLKNLLETKKVPELTKKVEERKPVSDLAHTKSDVKQISDLNNALHGKVGGNFPADHKQPTSPSIDEVKEIVVKDLAASEIPIGSTVISNLSGDLNKISKVDSEIKKDVPDMKGIVGISKDAKVLNMSDSKIPLAQTSSENGISLLETPLQIPSVIKINENEEKTKVNREILSKRV